MRILILAFFLVSSAWAQKTGAPYRLSMTMGIGVYALYNCLLPSPELKTLICISDDGRDSFKFELREEQINLGQPGVKPDPNTPLKTIGKVVGSLSGANIEAFGIDFWSLVKNPKKLGVCAEYGVHKFIQKGTFLPDREVEQSTHICIKNVEAIESEEVCKRAARSATHHRTSPVLYQLGKIEIDYEATTVTARSGILGQYIVKVKTKESTPRELSFLVLADVKDGHNGLSYCEVTDVQ